MAAGFSTLLELPLEQVTPEWSRRGLGGVKQMASWAYMKAGCHAKSHHHEAEQMFWVLKGSMKFRLDKETRIVRAGDLIHVLPNVEHECICLEDTEFLTILSPPRADLAFGAPPPDHF